MKYLIVLVLMISGCATHRATHPIFSEWNGKQSKQCVNDVVLQGHTLCCFNGKSPVFKDHWECQ